jgi:hypothetical protein
MKSYINKMGGVGGLHLVIKNKGLEEYEHRKMAKAFGTKRVGMPTKSGATTIPEELSFSCNDPADRANAFEGVAIGAKKQMDAVYQAVVKSLKGVRFKLLSEADEMGCPEWELVAVSSKVVGAGRVGGGGWRPGARDFSTLTRGPCGTRMTGIEESGGAAAWWAGSG